MTNTGVAQYDTDVEHLVSLIMMTDRCLYMTNNNGRNQVVADHSNREYQSRMIRISQIPLSDWHRVKHLSVSEPQRSYVSSMAELYDVASPEFHFHAIEADDDVVGFFNLDVAYGERYDFTEPGELGLRSYLIDQRHQGKGYGKAACQALILYLQQHYPDHPAIVLTVNCRNPGAYKAYLAAGFEDTGELYHGGLAGPQHIMRMALD